MDYGEVLAKAWKIIWKHKILWIFGILAGGVGGGGGGGGGNSGYRMNLNNNGSGEIPFFNGKFPFPEVEQWARQAGRWFDQIPEWLWILLAVAFVLFVVIAITLNVIGISGLIVGANRVDEGAEKLSFGEVWTGGLPYFWRIFGLRLLLGLGIMLVVLALILPAVFLGVAANLKLLILCLILPFMCLLVPIGWLVSLLIEQGSNAIIVENLGVFAAIGRAWNIIWANFWRMVVMALILWVGSLLVGLVLAAPFIALLVPVLVGAAVGQNQALRTGIVMSVVLGCLYLPILLVLGGIIKSYISSAWTLTFRRLTGRLPGTPIVVDAPVTPDRL